MRDVIDGLSRKLGENRKNQRKQRGNWTFHLPHKIQEILASGIKSRRRK
jgi:hypothetical protein